MRPSGELVAALARRPGLLLSLDPFELVHEEALPAWHELVAGLDLLFLSEDEMELPGGLAEPRPALRRLAGSPGRLRRIFYKQGVGGGLAFDVPGDRFHAWRPLPTRIVDATGAGDAFAGGLLAGRLLGDRPEAAIRRGLVSAGFALEGQGPEALLRATPGDAAERLHDTQSSPGHADYGRHRFTLPPKRGQCSDREPTGARIQPLLRGEREARGKHKVDTPKKHPVLVTGATGYIGGRLVPRLLEAGYRVRCLARSPRKLDNRSWTGHPQVEIVAGDVGDPEGLGAAMRGCDVAYYLVHSMVAAGSSYAAHDLELARNFAAAAQTAGCGRILYLGGLGETGAGLSEHLTSRRDVEEALAAGSVPVTVLRAAMIIGSGSASFEILRYLVERLPIMITPRWVSTECQPIGVRNVLHYLVEALESPETAGRTLDIGGPEVVTYLELMQTYAAGGGSAQADHHAGAGADAAALLAVDPPGDAARLPHRPAARRGPAQPRGLPR